LRATNPLEERLIALVEPVAAELGLRLVRVRIGGLKRKRLQIMAEREADGGMSVDNCADLSRALGPVLDAADPIKDDYDLEISSPGIDRPLVRLDDFVRFAGHEARLETAHLIDGRRRFKGAIIGIEGENVRMRTNEGDAAVPFSALSDARLILTDALIAEDLRRQEAEQKGEKPEMRFQPVTPTAAPRKAKPKATAAQKAAAEAKAKAPKPVKPSKTKP
jgi:ribosome maturation factor RimP